MRPGLSLGKIKPNDAVMTDRLDENVRRLADLVNGGLTFENLSPSLSLATTAFAEPNSIYTMSLLMPNVSGVVPDSPAIIPFGVIQVASKPISLGWVGIGNTTFLDAIGGGGFSLTVQDSAGNVLFINGATVIRPANEVLRFNNQAAMAPQLGPTNYFLRGIYYFDSRASIAANTVLGIGPAGPTGPLTYFNAVMVLATLHSA